MKSIITLIGGRQILVKESLSEINNMNECNFINVTGQRYIYRNANNYECEKVEVPIRINTKIIQTIEPI